MSESDSMRDALRKLANQIDKEIMDRLDGRPSMNIEKLDNLIYLESQMLRIFSDKNE